MNTNSNHRRLSVDSCPFVVEENDAVDLAGFGLPGISMEQLKHEVDVAVFNWEERRGLPHWPMTMHETINASVEEYNARKKRRKPLNGHNGGCATNGHNLKG